ncbi:hypothetical protein PRK78_001788 [Emydomyces testavorans]|uniref:Uncharacterized protein n=1 Tax=Emydomyces testavorans TaxID=2070801 RepID=A0AAF0DEJ9_9EURO|nr:hypothetical protein PRK78_001788 [Emydomyces testavorans]
MLPSYLKSQTMVPLLSLLSLLVQLVWANVEKTVFIAPPADAAELPSSLRPANLANIDTLSPSARSIRKHLDASFSSEKDPLGVRSWFHLVDLRPGQRYELRICWLATLMANHQQPTSFHLNTYTIADILDSPSLLSSLITYSASPHRQRIEYPSPAKVPSASPDQRSLLLAIDTAADYFTLNQTLMNDVPPVLADIILDPYLLNVFPKSLVPTAGYVAVTTVIALFVCRFVLSRAQGIIASSSTIELDMKKKSK